ncbi:DJ-1/PfpI family protein [Belnapia sp. T18]|uniref:DJ-1/PfpI family protein n=1 Tax=Belnapia arida TaxID=2804533 RepID=A0ABS1UB77_9PROT|nr:DJ-1/PfpI family protein [Belnapia arida]MBL6081938.1 DJ-1/PfpI family protein [Belnapia arida]
MSGHAGLFVPGGHAPVVDLMQDAALGTILRHFHETRKPTALLCHGPVAVAAAMPHAPEFRAALIAGDKARAAKYAQGWVYADCRMTVFSASEERIAEGALLHGKLYFDMPKALEAAGGRVTTNPVDFAPSVVVDRELITGQNPSSDHQLAAQMVEVLNRSLADAATP